MNYALVELLLWVCLGLFVWALWDGLGRVESEINAAELAAAGRAADARHRLGKDPGFAHPDELRQPIGYFRDTPIHLVAVINGKTYEFDRVCPPEERLHLKKGECCLEPGLVYKEST